MHILSSLFSLLRVKCLARDESCFQNSLCHELAARLFPVTWQPQWPSKYFNWRTSFDFFIRILFMAFKVTFAETEIREVRKYGKDVGLGLVWRYQANVAEENTCETLSDHGRPLGLFPAPSQNEVNDLSSHNNKRHASDLSHVQWVGILSKYARLHNMVYCIFGIKLNTGSTNMVRG